MINIQEKIDRCLGRVKLKNNTYIYAKNKKTNVISGILGDRSKNREKETCPECGGEIVIINGREGCRKCTYPEAKPKPR
jgi:ribosomal protein S27AE